MESTEGGKRFGIIPKGRFPENYHYLSSMVACYKAIPQGLFCLIQSLLYMNWPMTWVLDEYSQEQLFNIAATLTTLPFSQLTTKKKLWNKMFMKSFIKLHHIFGNLIIPKTYPELCVSQVWITWGFARSK